MSMQVAIRRAQSLSMMMNSTYSVISNDTGCHVVNQSTNEKGEIVARFVKGVRFS